MKKSYSAGILDEADRFQTQLNWMLFCQEQDAVLWAPRIQLTRNNQFVGPCHYKANFEDPRCLEHGEFSSWTFEFGPHRPCAYYAGLAWYPGDPIYQYGEGNCVRFMIDEFEDAEHYQALDYNQIECPDCDVCWKAPGFKGGSAICWLCGSYPEPIGPRRVNSLDLLREKALANYLSGRQSVGRVVDSEETEQGLMVTFRLDNQFAAVWRRAQEQMNEMMDRMILGAENFGQSLRGMSNYMAFVDEGSCTPWDGLIEPYCVPIVAPTPFQRSEQPANDIPLGERLYNPLTDANVSYVQARRVARQLQGVDLSVRPRITPPVINIDSGVRDHQPRWVEFTQPNWRRR